MRLGGKNDLSIAPIDSTNKNFTNLVINKDFNIGISLTREALLEGKVSTIDLLVLTSLDAAFHIEAIFFRFYK